MFFVRPTYFEITLANWRKDDFHDEVLICTINEDFEVIEHVPVDLFIGSRNMAIIYGLKSDGDWTGKEMMQVGTKRQEYAGWDPILTAHDFEKMVQKKINKELTKVAAFEKEPKKYPFYRDYA